MKPSGVLLACGVQVIPNILNRGPVSRDTREPNSFGICNIRLTERAALVQRSAARLLSRCCCFCKCCSEFLVCLPVCKSSGLLEVFMFTVIKGEVGSAEG